MKFTGILQTFVRPMVLLACLAVAVLPGCGLIGGIYGVFIDPLVPPPTIEAEHDMKESRVLVWVDDAYIEQPDPFLRRYITQALGERLVANDAVAEMVDYAEIARFRQEHADLTGYTVAELGEAFGADEVLYLLIERFQLHHDAGQGFYRPELAGYAKVVRVEDGKGLWPEEQNKQAFHYDSQLVEGGSPAFERKLLESLASTIANDLAPRFYRHQVPKR